MERMINSRLVSAPCDTSFKARRIKIPLLTYLLTSVVLRTKQAHLSYAIYTTIQLCGFRKQRSITDHLVRLESFVREAFAQRQHAVGVFFDLEKANESTWKFGITRDLHDAGLRGRLPSS